MNQSDSQQVSENLSSNVYPFNAVVSIEKVEGKPDSCYKNVKVVLDKSGAEAAYNKEYAKTVSKVKIDGFRPGKAPKALIETQYGDSIWYQGLENAVSEIIKKVSSTIQAQIFESPTVNLEKADRAEGVTFALTYVLWPTPAISNYDSFNVKVAKKEVTDADVQKEIDAILTSKKKFEAAGKEDKVEEGGYCVGKLTATVDGEEVSCNLNSGASTFIALGQNEWPEEFEKNVIGMKEEQEKSFTVDMPEDFKAVEWAGEKVSFKLLCTKIYKVMLPELNDELVKSLGYGSVSTVDELKEVLKKDVQSRNEQEEKNQIADKVLEQILTGSPFDVADEIVEAEIKTTMSNMGMPNQSIDTLKKETVWNEIWSTHTKQVKNRIILERIGDQEKIQPSNEALSRVVSDNMMRSKMPVNKAKRILTSPSALRRQAYGVVLENVVEMLISRAKIQ